MKRIARRAARTDSNHAEIVKVLRQCGMAVQDLSACGGGVPDLLVGWRGMNMLLEIKRPNAPPSKQLTQAQTNWHETWPGALAVVESAREAVDAVCGACGAWSPAILDAEGADRSA